MKFFIYVATVAGIIVGLFLPDAVTAQVILTPSFPTRSDPTPVFIPPLPPIVITTITTQIDPIIIDPSTNYFPGSITNIDDHGSYPLHRGFDDRRQPTVIFPQQYIYPRAVRSTCTTTIIGSPIPSPIALNRFTGAPCR